MSQFLAAVDMCISGCWTSYLALKKTGVNPGHSSGFKKPTTTNISSWNDTAAHTMCFSVCVCVCLTLQTDILYLHSNFPTIKHVRYPGLIRVYSKPQPSNEKTGHYWPPHSEETKNYEQLIKWSTFIQQAAISLQTSSSVQSGLCSAIITILSSFSTFIENTAILKHDATTGRTFSYEKKNK